MTSRPLSGDDTARLLAQTSRTFALAIPLLEEPLRTQVGLAYLLFRIADTLEDAPSWQRDRRAEALRSFSDWLEDVSQDRWLAIVREHAPSRDQGEVELLDVASDVLTAVREGRGAVADVIVKHTRRTALGMEEFVRRQDERGAIVLNDLDDLRRYTYVVAGIVGEMLTDLFALADDRVARVRVTLDADAGSFGEALQLVNILKDREADAREGRSYLPPQIPRAAVVELARSDLGRASKYVDTLVKASAPRGVVAFCELPVRLAAATLDALEAGASKLTRDQVLAILTSVVGRS